MVLAVFHAFRSAARSFSATDMCPLHSRPQFWVCASSGSDLHYPMIDLAEAGQRRESEFVTRVPLPPDRLDALSRDILQLK